MEYTLWYKVPSLVDGSQQITPLLVEGCQQGKGLTIMGLTIIQGTSMPSHTGLNRCEQGSTRVGTE